MILLICCNVAPGKAFSERPGGESFARILHAFGCPVHTCSDRRHTMCEHQAPHPSTLNPSCTHLRTHLVHTCKSAENPRLYWRCHTCTLITLVFRGAGGGKVERLSKLSCSLNTTSDRHPTDPYQVIRGLVIFLCTLSAETLWEASPSLEPNRGN